MVKPNYDNSIMSITNSLLKYYGVKPHHATLPLADELLEKDYKNVMHLGNPTNTIAVLNRYGFSFQKKFGQNFLIDENVVEWE